MNPLQGTWFKVNRAKKHFDELDASINAFLSRNPFFFLEQEHPDPSLRSFRFKEVDRPPIDWAFILGDFAFNLRSALDHLAWQLALLKTDTPSTATEFPIFHDRREYELRAPRKIDDIINAAHPIIESLQPYNGTDGPKAHMLWLLHELNRVDKHRHAIPQFSQPVLDYGGGKWLRGQGKLNDGATIVIPKSFEGSDKVELKVEICFDVDGFPSEIRKIHLNNIYKFVTDEVIPRFLSFLM